MRTFSALCGLVVVGFTTAALAGEPTRLADHDLDRVSAGLFDGTAIAFTNDARLSGASMTLFERSATLTVKTTELDPPSFNANFEGLAISQLQARSSGVGFTQAQGGGGVRLTIGASQ